MPEHWEIRRLKHTSTLHGRIGFHGLSTSDYGSNGIIVVSGSNFRDWHVDWNRCHRISKDWYEKDKNIQLRNGDLLVTKDGTIGKTAIVSELTERAVPNSGVIVVRPRMPIQYENRYLMYLINSKVFNSFIDIKKTGATIHHLYEATFNNFSISLPQISEQSTIVKFLDYIDRRIRRYIHAKQKLIKLLEEQKQAIIQKAVTGGLDTNVRFKESGVEWLGEIPDHWEVRQLGRCLRKIEQGWSPVAENGELTETQWAVLTLSSVKRGNFKPDAIKPIAMSAEIPKGIEVYTGDFLLTRSNTRNLVGDVCVVDKVRPKTIICDLIYRLHIDDKILEPRFLMYQLLAPHGRRQIEQDARGSSNTMPKIAQRHIKTWKVLFPSIEEQRSITEMIDTCISQIDNIISLIEREMFLLREYRTRLIADLVTGKLDVREAAASLPEETE